MDIDERIAAANRSLGEIGVTINNRNGKLYLRGTFPALPGSKDSKPKQARIATHQRATPAGIKQATILARRLRVELDEGRFEWCNWSKSSRASRPVTAVDWAQQFQKDYFARRGCNLKTQTTWKTDYELVYEQLPLEPLSADLAIALVERMSRVNTRSRIRYCMALTALCRFAGVAVDLKPYRGRYSSKSVDPRFLPSDRAVVTIGLNIADPQWRLTWGMLATYGLRPHELYHLDFSQFPVVEVLAETKTERRLVVPFYQEWVDLWELKQFKHPPVALGGTNKELGSRVSNHFSRQKYGLKAIAIGSKIFDRHITPYTLRHAYARRLFDFDVPIKLAAKLMGHSASIHECVYQAWIDDATVIRKALAIGQRSDKPAPMNVSDSRFQEW